jgi:hypothetical protein
MKGEREKRRLALGTELAAFSTRIIRACLHVEASCVLEIPARSQFLFLLATEGMMKDPRMQRTDFDQCCHWGRWKKKTALLYGYCSLDALGGSCACVVAHLKRTGKGPKGETMAKLAAPYPWTLVERLSRALVEGRPWKREELLEDVQVLPVIEGVPVEEGPNPRAARGPPVSRAWDSPNRWRLVAKTKWKVDSHINEQEARAFLLALRHVSRSGQRRGRRVLVLSDSLVVAGAVGKGRSSSHRLNFHCRRACALAMFWGTRPYVRYIATHRNPTDRPSRGGRIGNDSATKARKMRLQGGLHQS